MLEQLREQRGGGDTVIQVGDLVDNGGNSALWSRRSSTRCDGLDLQFATMVGNHETYGDHEVHTVLSTGAQPASSTRFSTIRTTAAQSVRATTRSTEAASTSRC